jgi:hypothetical protein
MLKKRNVWIVALIDGIAIFSPKNLGISSKIT